MQEQYKFVHTAVRELLLCGDTTLKTADLRAYIKSMAQVDRKKNKPGFETLFEVCTVDHGHVGEHSCVSVSKLPNVANSEP